MLQINIGKKDVQTQDLRAESYGAMFNSNGGGVYALEWTSAENYNLVLSTRY